MENIFQEIEPGFLRLLRRLSILHYNLFNILTNYFICLISFIRMDMCCHHKESDFESNQEDNAYLVHMIAGSIAGVMEHISIFPLDTIKTNMQSCKEIISMKQTTKNLYNNGGFSRFWRGVLIIAATSVPAHAGYFSAYEFAKIKLNVDKHGYQFLSSALTGAFASLLHDLILTPSDVIKQRMQLSGSKDYIKCINQITKTEGLLSFYRSLPITLLINAPNTITIVVVNENLKKLVQPQKRQRKYLAYIICAGVAGLVIVNLGSLASLITTTLDNIKTKIQTQKTISSCDKHIENKVLTKDKEIKNFKHECTIDGNVKYKDIVSTAKIIYKENGFLKGFLRGMLPRVICNAPCCAISWGTYEFIKYHLLKFKLNGIYHPHI